MPMCCKECGSEIPEGNDGFCPKCLLQLAEVATHQEGGDEVSNAIEDVESCSVAEVESPGQWVGRYKLLEIIGEGGFGTVWMAEQIEPVTRRVALKIIKLGMDTRAVVARFEAERQALALMDHPNIARVLDAGATQTGRPYFVMELLRGLPITSFCDSANLNTRARLELFVQVCRAVQHAHQKGIIHRDIKPSNILVGIQDGHPVPKVIDFGIAKATGSRLTEKTLFTRFHEFIGTPAYISPEQAGLGSVDIDTRTDVYSLGVLLYELLSGRPPFDARALLQAGLQGAFKIIKEQEPPKLSNRLASLSIQEQTTVAISRSEGSRQLHKLLLGELDWIVHKALEKDRARRYESAIGLGEDVERYLHGEPISAAVPGLAYRFSKFAAKHRVGLAVSMAFALVLVAGIVATSWQAIRAARLARSESQLRAEERLLLYASETAVAFKAWELGQAQRTRHILENQRPKTGENKDLRGWEWRYLWGQSRPMEAFVFPPEPGFVSGIAYAPSGLRLAVASGGNGTIRMWDTREYKLLKENKLGEYIIDSIVFAPDEASLYVSTRDTNFFQLDATTLEVIANFPGHTQRVTGVALDASGKTLVSAAGDLYGQPGQSETFVWDVPKKEIAFRLPPVAAYAAYPQLSSSGRYLIRGMNQGGIVEIWDLHVRQKIADFKIHNGLIYTAVLSPDESLLASCGQDGFVRVWDWRRHEEVAAFGRPGIAMLDVEFTPDGRRVVSCGLDGTLRIWDVVRGKEQAVLRGHSGRVQHFAVSPDSQWIASGGGPDQTVRIWDSSTCNLERVLDIGFEALALGQFSRDTATYGLLRTGADSSVLKVWQIAALASRETNRLVRTFETHDALSFAFAGTNLALSVSGSREISVREPGTARELRELRSPLPLGGPIVASPDAKFLAAASFPDFVSVWSAESETPFILNLGTSGNSNYTTGTGALFFSPKADRLWVLRPDEKQLELWDWRASQKLGTLARQDRLITAVAISPEGKILACGSADMSVRLWDSGTGSALDVLPGEGGAVMSLGFSPDGRTLAAGYYDGQLKLWNVPARTEVTSIQAHSSIVCSVAFSPDGTTLVSAGYDGTTRFWQAPLFEVTDAGKDK